MRFEGLLGGPGLARLFRNARAVVVPSLFPETFGYVVLEAFSVGTPVVVHEGGGALYETGFMSGGGLAYRTDSELLTALRRMVHDRALHDDLAARGFAMRMGPWSETEHIDDYLTLIAHGQAARDRQPFPRPHALDRYRSGAGARCGLSLWRLRRRGCEDRGLEPATWSDLAPGATHVVATSMATRWTGTAAGAHCARMRVLRPLDRRSGGPDCRRRETERRPCQPRRARGVGNDATFSFLPHHLSIARIIRRHGHVPIWDDRGFGGRPAGRQPAGGHFLPSGWLAWWSGAPAALGWLTAFHLIWGGLGMYVLVRSFQIGRWSATVAAAIYQTSPFLLAHTFEGHYPHVWAACWYPWAFWAFSQRRSGSPRGRLYLPLILAATSLTGHPQEWFLLMLALSAWAF